MNISRRLFLVGPVVLLAPTHASSAAPVIQPATSAGAFANDPARRSALNHLIGVVKRTAKELRHQHKVCGDNNTSEMSPLSQFCYMENGDVWDTIDPTDDEAIEATMLSTLQQIATDVKDMCEGRHQSASGIPCSLEFSVTHLGFGSIPFYPSIDGTPETDEALRTLIMPLFET